MHLCDARYQKQILTASGLFPPPQRIQSVLSICFFSKVFYCTITHNSQLLVGFAQKLECLTVCSRKEHIKKQACNIDHLTGKLTRRSLTSMKRPDITRPAKLGRTLIIFRKDTPEMTY